MVQITLFDLLMDDKKDLNTVNNETTNWLFIDGNNLLNRAYYPTSKRLTTAPDGRYTNGVTLFLKMMLSFQRKLNVQVAVMFDDGKSFRKDIYPPYKEGRSETPGPLVEQFPLIREILNRAEIPVFMNSEFEADDLIASAINQVEGHVYILSNDRDLYQLISDRVTVIVRKGTDDVYMTPSQFSSEYEGFNPRQIIDLKALEGDSSDNIPGVKGIGGTGAMNLLKAFPSIEELVSVKEFPSSLQRYKTKIESGKGDAVFFKELITLRTDIPLSLSTYQMNTQACLEICETLAIQSVIKLLKNW